MAAPPDPADGLEGAHRSRRRVQAAVAVGLVTTFVGLASITVVLPVPIAASGAAFGLLAVGVVGLFVGGSLLGFAAAAARAVRRGR